MMRIRSAFVFVLLTVVAVGAQAQFVAPLHLIPVVAKVGGVAGSDWRSDLSISNLSTSATQVGVKFFREETANFWFPGTFDHQVTLSAGETLLVEDVLGSWFADEGNTKGALLVAATDVFISEEGSPLAVNSRTYDGADPDATFGQAVTSSLTNILVGPGRIVMTGARQDDRFRSNVGVLNLGLQASEVVVTIYDNSGAVVNEQTNTVQPLSLSQWPLSALGVATLDGGGRVDVRLAESAIPDDPCQYEITLGLPVGIIMAYLSKADNATNDAEFVLGQVDWAEYAEECGGTPDGC